MLKSRCFEGERIQPLCKNHKINVALATEGNASGEEKTLFGTPQARLG